MSASDESATPPLRWAVVGIGRHSRQYVIPAIAASRSGTLAALVTSDPGSARSFVSRFGEPAIVGSLGEAVDAPDVDAVFLVSPNSAHLTQTLRAAEAGKHVLCEKPLATTTAEAVRMVNACRRAGVRLGTGFHLRHNLVHRRARDLIQDGRIGEIDFVSARYAHQTAPRPATGPGPESGIPPVAAWRKDPSYAGGGAFVSTGSHAIDLVRFLAGAEFLSVQAAADEPAMHEQNLAFVAQLPRGAIATVQAGELAYPANEIAVSGSLGTIVCTGSVGNAGAGTLTLATAAGVETYTPATHDVYAAECDRFAEAVRNGTEPDASGLDGLRCQQVIDAAYASAATGTLVPVAAEQP